jgi:hypothetical protein
MLELGPVNAVDNRATTIVIQLRLIVQRPPTIIARPMGIGINLCQPPRRLVVLVGKKESAKPLAMLGSRWIRDVPAAKVVRTPAREQHRSSIL